MNLDAEPEEGDQDGPGVYRADSERIAEMCAGFQKGWTDKVRKTRRGRKGVHLETALVDILAHNGGRRKKSG
jgi:hypothetical protein